MTALQQIVDRIQEQNYLEGHPKPVFSVSFSRIGQILASGSSDGTIKLWRRNGQFIQTLHHAEDGERVFRVIFTGDGQSLISASHKDIKIWQHQPDKLLPSANIFRIEMELALASANGDSTVKLWTLNGNLSNKTLQGHKKAVLDVSFSPDGKTIASASADETVRLWNLEDGTSQVFPHQAQVNRVAFSPSGQVLASASEDKTIKFWNLDGKLLQDLRGFNTSIVNLGFSGDYNTLAAADNGGQVMLQNLNLDNLLKISCNLLGDYLNSRPLNSQENLCTKRAPSLFQDKKPTSSRLKY